MCLFHVFVCVCVCVCVGSTLFDSSKNVTYVCRLAVESTIESHSSHWTRTPSGYWYKRVFPFRKKSRNEMCHPPALRPLPAHLGSIERAGETLPKMFHRPTLNLIHCAGLRGTKSHHDGHSRELCRDLFKLPWDCNGGCLLMGKDHPWWLAGPTWKWGWVKVNLSTNTYTVVVQTGVGFLVCRYAAGEWAPKGLEQCVLIVNQVTGSCQCQWLSYSRNTLIIVPQCPRVEQPYIQSKLVQRTSRISLNAKPSEAHWHRRAQLNWKELQVEARPEPMNETLASGLGLLSVASGPWTSEEVAGTLEACD